MRLGVDITPLQSVSPGGIGTATYETLRALAQLPGIEIVLYGTAPPVVPFSGAPLDIDLPLRVGSGLLARSNIAWIRYGVSPLLRRDAIDVFWGTRNVLPSDTDRAALVATLYDFWHIHHPGQQPLVNRSKKRYIVEQYFGLSHLYNNAFRARFTRITKNAIDVLFRQMAFNLFRGGRVLGTV